MPCAVPMAWRMLSTSHTRAVTRSGRTMICHGTSHIAVYYCLLFLVEYATAVLVFLTARRLVGESSLALACALLWAVYLSDPSTMWLSTFAYRFGAMQAAPSGFGRRVRWMRGARS